MKEGVSDGFEVRGEKGEGFRYGDVGAEVVDGGRVGSGHCL